MIQNNTGQTLDHFAFSYDYNDKITWSVLWYAPNFLMGWNIHCEFIILAIKSNYLLSLK